MSRFWTWIGEPCPILAESHVQILDTNLVIEPVITTPRDAHAREGADRGAAERWAKSLTDLADDPDSPSTQRSLASRPVARGSAREPGADRRHRQRDHRLVCYGLRPRSRHPATLAERTVTSDQPDPDLGLLHRGDRRAPCPAGGAGGWPGFAGERGKAQPAARHDLPGRPASARRAADGPDRTPRPSRPTAMSWTWSQAGSPRAVRAAQRCVRADPRRADRPGARHRSPASRPADLLIPERTANDPHPPRDRGSP